MVIDQIAVSSRTNAQIGNDRFSFKMSSPSPIALPYPFLRQEFLQALEGSHSVGDDAGWEPLHITLSTERHNHSMPLYLKHHSMGEYVFDHAWANAYY